MTGVGGIDRVTRLTDSQADDYRSPRPELRQARRAVQIVLVVLWISFVGGLVASALTGWALTINPAAASAPLESMPVSPNVLGMVLLADRVTIAAGLVATAALLLAGVFVIRWQSAALRNGPALGGGTHWSPLAAGIAWLVPVWSLFGPKQVFNELWRRSEPGRPVDGDRTVIATVRLPAFHSGWWVLWVSANLLDVTALVATMNSNSVTAVLVGQLASVIVAAGLAGAGVWLLRIMRLTTRRQELRFAELTAPMPAAPTRH